MKIWKILAPVCAGMIVITLVIAFVCRCTYANNGLDDIRSVTEYLEYCKKAAVKAVDEPNDEGKTAESIKANTDYYIDSVSQEGTYVHYDLQVFVVEVEDKESDMEETLFQRGSTMVQYVKVIKVLQGDDIENEYINIYSMLGIGIDNNGTPVNYGANGKNAMLPGNRYLVFCEAMENMKELENYEGTTLKYREIYSLFSQLNITTDMTELLNEDVGLTDWKNIEFFVYNQETLEVLLDIKHEILASYGIIVGEE